jgi:quinol monooxygenase YgiN
MADHESLVLRSAAPDGRTGEPEDYSILPRPQDIQNSPDPIVIIRVVRLTLKPEEKPEFLALFNEVKDRIRASSGCLNLRLLEDSRYPNIVTTLSEWSDEASLEAYRSTEFFRETWSRTKRHFAAAPSAHTYHVIE